MDQEHVDNKAVQASGLTRCYPGRRGRRAIAALDNLDLMLPKGQGLMLAGANGAGKSTALRLFAGVEKQTNGLLRILGRSPLAEENRLRVGYLPDSSDLFPFLDVEETLTFFAAAARLNSREARRRTEELIGLLEMGDWKKKRAGSFSLGMKRRLGLACVLIGSPDLLILDEPTSGLDPRASELFLKLCRREKERGVTVVLSSHHLRQAEGLCDQILVMKEGRSVFQGTLAELCQVTGRCEVEISGLDEEGVAALGNFLSKRGASFLGRHVSERSLGKFMGGQQD